MSTSLTDENPTVPHIVFGERSQSLARKISHVWRDLSRGQWIIVETKVVRSLCIGVSELFQFHIVIFPSLNKYYVLCENERIIFCIRELKVSTLSYRNGDYSQYVGFCCDCPRQTPRSIAQVCNDNTRSSYAITYLHFELRLNILNHLVYNLQQRILGRLHKPARRFVQCGA